jgi:hypothetical protein
MFIEASEARPGQTLDPVQGKGFFAPDQTITEVTRQGDDTYVITTDQGVTYTLPGWYPLLMPCRTDGQPVTFDQTPVPRAFDLCMGDKIIHEGVTHTVIDVRHQGDKPTGVAITTATPDGASYKALGDLYAPFTPGQDEVIPVVRQHEREEHPLRGPYEDREREGVVYWFHVHPYGGGRWPHGMVPFRRQESPGEYTSRPPARLMKQWWPLLKFAGTELAMRHPYDPVLEAHRRSGTGRLL